MTQEIAHIVITVHAKDVKAVAVAPVPIPDAVLNVAGLVGVWNVMMWTKTQLTEKMRNVGWVRIGTGVYKNVHTKKTQLYQGLRVDGRIIERWKLYAALEELPGE